MLPTADIFSYFEPFYMNLEDAILHRRNVPDLQHEGRCKYFWGMKNDTQKIQKNGWEEATKYITHKC